VAARTGVGFGTIIKESEEARGICGGEGNGGGRVVLDDMDFVVFLDFAVNRIDILKCIKMR
jgi:hypothetical protein